MDGAAAPAEKDIKFASSRRARARFSGFSRFQASSYRLHFGIAYSLPHSLFFRTFPSPMRCCCLVRLLIGDDGADQLPGARAHFERLPRMPAAPARGRTVTSVIASALLFGHFSG